MKLPETKLNIGDSAWIMHKDRPADFIIYRIEVKVNESRVTICYKGKYNDYYRDFYEEEIGKNWFISKKNLFLSQFGDCLEEGLVVK